MDIEDRLGDTMGEGGTNCESSTETDTAESLQSCPTLCDPIDIQPTGMPRPWDSPGKNTGVGCHFLLQCMKVKSESEVAQSCQLFPVPAASRRRASVRPARPTRRRRDSKLQNHSSFSLLSFV